MAVTTRRRPVKYHTKKREESEQQQFVNWVKKNFPHVIVFCDAMGEDLSDTGRQRVFAMRSRLGIPDIIIDYPSRGFHGMRLEMKRTGTAIYKRDGKTLRKATYTRRYIKHGKLFIKTGDHLQEQAMTLKEYNDRGYFARFAKGLEHAKQLFRWYMELPEPQELDLPF